MGDPVGTRSDHHACLAWSLFSIETAESANIERHGDPFDTATSFVGDSDDERLM